MWLLDNEKAFQGRRFWLRPGKTYLFGRTVAEPGQLAILHSTISRKHLTITVDSVAAGESNHVSSRTGIAIEDLATRYGTVVNGQKIKGSKYAVSGDEAEITMAKCPDVFRLKWCPVVFTFSFTKKELQAQPMQSLRDRFEQLDIKLLIDYDTQYTSHVISKKRNTAKGLQALINGKRIVTESFLDAVSAVTEADESDISGFSHLEQDFDRYWPNEMEHLPPRGTEPVLHPDDIYTPDVGRKNVFEGYTFIFYDQTQFHNLLAPITDGCGKALLRVVDPNKTTVNEYVQYVKGVAGEKGLGRFDDDSEGKGVVLVRYLPAKGDLISWYTEFLTNVSLKLDHRPIEQNEFLEAILIKDASKLRRPLEVESSYGDQEYQRQQSRPGSARPADGTADSRATPATQNPSQSSQMGLASQRAGARRPVKKRFAGFDDDDDDINMKDIPFASATDHAQSTQALQEEEGGLFVSQDPDAPLAGAESEDVADRFQRAQRKRTAEPIPEDDLMEGMAPAMAKFKRQRLHEVFTPALPEPKPEPESQPKAQVSTPPTNKKKQKKVKEELDVLAVAAKNREEAEARARAEQEDLANLPEGIDLAEIRRLHIVEEMDVRVSERTAQRTRDQDVADGRWNPKWNGVKNFKKFRRRGEATGRQPARVIITLTEAKNKEFGVGDNYWLENEGGSGQKAKFGPNQSLGEIVIAQKQGPPPLQRNQRVFTASESAEENEGEGEEEEEEEEEEVHRDETAMEPESANKLAFRSGGPQPKRSTRGKASQSNMAKRAATEPPASRETPPAKKPRSAMNLGVSDSEGSEDELKFRFGKRR